MGHDTRRERLLTVLTVLGGFLLSLSNTTSWTWGNMAVYVFSYMRAKDITEGDVESPWLLSFFIVCTTIGIWAAGQIVKVFGRRWTILTGMLINDCGLICSFFSMKHSLLALSVTNGALTGLGCGIIYYAVLLFVIEWSDKNEGLLLAILSTAPTLGGSLYIQIMTRYINPNDKPPSLLIGTTNYFTQKDVIDAVPDVYLLTGIVTIILQVIGLSLLRDKIKSSDAETCNHEALTLNSRGKSYTSQDQNSQIVDRGVTDMDIKPASGNAHSITCSGVADGNGANNQSSAVIENEFNSKSEDGEILKTAHTDDESKNYYRSNYKPSQVLRDLSFYIFWISLLSNEFGYVVFANYYKQFGQIYIPNDHFLAGVGTAISLAVVSTRIIWGMILDRFGFKVMMIIFSAAFSILFAFFFLTPMINIWMYSLWCILIASVDAGLFCNFSFGTLKLYGQKYYSTNLTLVMSSSVIVSVGAPPLLRYMLSGNSWFLVFFTISMGNFISVLLVIWGMPVV